MVTWNEHVKATLAKFPKGTSLSKVLPEAAKEWKKIKASMGMSGSTAKKVHHKKGKSMKKHRKHKKGGQVASEGDMEKAQETAENQEASAMNPMPDENPEDRKGAEDIGERADAEAAETANAQEEGVVEAGIGGGRRRRKAKKHRKSKKGGDDDDEDDDDTDDDDYDDYDMTGGRRRRKARKHRKSMKGGQVNEPNEDPFGQDEEPSGQDDEEEYKKQVGGRRHKGRKSHKRRSAKKGSKRHGKRKTAKKSRRH